MIYFLEIVLNKTTQQQGPRQLPQQKHEQRRQQQQTTTGQLQVVSIFHSVFVTHKLRDERLDRARINSPDLSLSPDNSLSCLELCLMQPSTGSLT